MKQSRKIIIGLMTLLTVNSCSVSEKYHRNITYSINGGVNQGGIIENTDLTQAGETKVDAFTGATKMGFHAGGKINIPVRNNSVETGLDFIASNQTFTYNDPANDFVGERRLQLNQFVMPVTYNIGMFRKNNSQGLFQIKLGYAVQFNPSCKVDDSVDGLPQYSMKKWSNGINLGISFTPVVFIGGSKLGIYIDVYRGTRIYTDFYNSTSAEMPGSSNFKAGITYQFK